MTVVSPAIRDKTSVATRLGQYLMFGSLFLAPLRSRVRILQRMDGCHNLFGEQSFHHNLGYWADAPRTLDEACDALAGLVARKAGIGPGTQVLDVGCGFGDQDLHWARHSHPDELVAVDLMPFKIDIARGRAQELGARAPRFEVCEATRLTFPADRFDVVVALEASFHFVTRKDFCAEAARVLRPGGTLALAEPAPCEDAAPDRLGRYLQRTVVATPSENLYPASGYRRMLEGLGFTRVEVTSIREHVYRPFLRYLEQRLRDPEIRRVNPLVRGMWKGWIGQFERRGADNGQDYLVVTATKP